MTRTTPDRPGDRRALTVAVFVSVVAFAFESMGVSTAMPRAAQDLDGIGVYAWAFSLFVVGMLAATVASGRMADRVGPLRPLAAGIAAFVVGLVVAGTATTMAQLLAGRFIQGIGAGAANLALYVVVALVYPEDERATVMTWVSTAWVVPSLIGPSVAAWVTETWSWHWVFLGIIGLVAVGAVVGTRPLLAAVARLDGNDAHEQDPVPWWSGMVVAVCAVALQFAGQRAGAGQRGVLEVVLLTGAVAGLLVALPRMMPPGFLRVRRGISSVVLARALTAGAFFGADAFLPLMLVETRGLSLLMAGGIVTIGSLGWFCGSWLQSRTWLHIPRHRLIIIGQLLIGFGCLGMIVIAALPQVPVGFAAVFWVPAGLGMGLSIASTTLAVMSLSTPAQQGRNSSSLQVGEALGNSVIVGVAGTIFAFLHPGGDLELTFATILAAMGVLALAGSSVATRIGRLEQRR